MQLLPATTPVVLIVEDDEDHAELLWLALRGMEDFQCRPMHCASLQEARRRIHDPTVTMVLLDYRLGAGTSEQFLIDLREAGDPRPVVIVTGQGDEYLAAQLTRRGADGYVAKRDLTTRLPQVIREIQKQQRGRSGEQEHRLEVAERLRSLTEREAEVLDLIVQGLLTKEIARRLHRSEYTIKLHRAALMRKMKANTPGDLVRLVLEARQSQRPPRS